MKILKEEGFGLLEILVALAIFGMLLGALLTMMKQENELIRDSLEGMNASLKANEVMETLKMRSFEGLKSYSSLVLSELKQMTIQVAVSDFNKSHTLKKIAVTVKWFDQRGHEKQYVLTTLRSKYNTHHASVTMGKKGGAS